jgi:fatty-acyl-CoA synthase
VVLHTLSSRAALAAMGEGLFKDEDVYMPITPMFHVHAWGFPYIATMLGVKQVYCGRYAADSVVALFQREKVTISHCVPTILRMLLDSAKAKGVPLSGWKMIIGGAALCRRRLPEKRWSLGLTSTPATGCRRPVPS